MYLLRIGWRELLRMQCHALKNITSSLYNESNITNSCNFMHLQQYDILSIKLIKKENRFYLIVFIIYVLYGCQICLVSLGTDVSNQSLLLKWVCQ